MEKDHKMDTSIIIFLILMFILWLDNKRRNSRIQKMWDNLGKPHIMVESKSAVGTSRGLTDDEKETLSVLVDVIKKHELDHMESIIAELPADDDELIKELVNDVKDELKVVVDEDTQQDATTALKKLGYKQTQIKKAMDTIVSSSDGQLSSADIVTKALPLLNN